MAIFFLLWLCISAVHDFLYKKCFNYMAVSGLGLALLSAYLGSETAVVKVTLSEALVGGSAAFLVFLIFYACRLMGAGDVKFAAALGAWLGWQLLLPVWALSCVFAVLHGVAARSPWLHALAPRLQWNEKAHTKVARFIPYVSYLSISTVIVLMLQK